MTEKRRSSYRTLAEHDAQLKAEGKWDAYVATRDQKEIEFETREAAYRTAELPLVEELQSAGFTVASVWDFVNTKNSYSGALHILLNHLNRDYPPAIRDGIARAMAVPQSRFAWHDLVRCYQNEEDSRAKDGLAVAVAAAADNTVLDEFIALIKDHSLGSSRVLLLRALTRFRNAKARTTLMELGTDPDLGQEIQIILRQLNSRRPKIQK